MKERWGKSNNNPIESRNNWIGALRQLSIPCLVSDHLQCIGSVYEEAHKANAFCNHGLNFIHMTIYNDIVLRSTLCSLGVIT